MKTILVPTDFSAHAKFALNLAKQIAFKTKASIQLLHIVEQPSHYLTAVSGGVHDQIDNMYVLKLIEKVKAQLQVIANEQTQQGVNTGFKIKIGNPFKHISALIKSEDYDLIVMGTKGISGLQEVMVGSNTEKVIRHADCPVITLKREVDIESIKNIVFAVDYFSQDQHLANNLKFIQALFGAKVHLVTINTPGNFLIERHLLNSLQEFVEQHQISNCTINIYSDIAEEEGIVHFAEDQMADAIVMGTHRRTGISHLLAGSLSEDMVNHSTLPVITFPLKNKKNSKKDLEPKKEPDGISSN
ncbi:MAG: universal stress protein UspA [Cyclobacteriaceae bacterium]|nr:MAG: universal stress protein UspA [Cyclobacteriaceae bacterium]